MKIVFMGTPDFALPPLKALCESHHEVSLVVTQPDKAIGRGNKIRFSPIKEYAISQELEVVQPIKIKNDVEVIDEIKSIQPDIIVVVAFGQILTKDILNIPKYGCFNIHASILPAYRGAAPIQWAIYDGQKESGVTIMKMDEGLDTGDILHIEKVVLDKKETGASLFEKLSQLGAESLIKVLDNIEYFLENRIPQPEDSTTSYAKLLHKDSGKINWKRSAVEIERQIRAFNPWPGSYSHLGEKLLKIFDAEVIQSEIKGDVGSVVKVTHKEIFVQTGDGLLLLKEIQLEGKRRMFVDDFLRGRSVEEGTHLK